MAGSSKKKYPPDTIDVNQLRRKLVWLLPLMVALLGGCWWLAKNAVFSEIAALRNSGPLVEVTPAAVVIPMFSAMLCFMIALAVLRAIPCQRSLVWTVEITFVWFLIVGYFTTLVLTVAISLLQNSYMVEWGYSSCKVLAGNNNRWSSVWVKNPDWCVKGKTREWVNEQARLLPK